MGYVLLDGKEIFCLLPSLRTPQPIPERGGEVEAGWKGDILSSSQPANTAANS
jgi:hypothetical protein